MTLSLRPATPDDESLLLEWANSADSLAGKLETRHPISRAEHKAWFATRLAEEGCQIHIVNWSGTPIGQVRIERKCGLPEVDIYVVPEFRGQGVGLSALRQALSLYRKAHGLENIVARIRSANQGSQKLFRRAGFLEHTVSADHVVLVMPAVSATSAAHGEKRA